MIKICNSCKINLDINCFNKRGKNGFQHKCRDCTKRYGKDNYLRFKDVNNEKRKAKIAAKPKKSRKTSIGRIEKNCWHCETVKPLYEFHKSKKMSDGHATECKLCKKSLDKEYRNKLGKLHTTKINEAKKIARKNNPEYYRAKGRFYANTRRALKIQGSLNNQYNDQIEEIYFNCPDGYHVDHIVPLNNPIVCGLHVPWNLQYLTKFENLSKGNKL